MSTFPIKFRTRNNSYQPVKAQSSHQLTSYIISYIERRNTRITSNLNTIHIQTLQKHPHLYPYLFRFLIPMTTENEVASAVTHSTRSCFNTVSAKTVHSTYIFNSVYPHSQYLNTKPPRKRPPRIMI